MAEGFASLEQHFAIIGANLVLSRYVYQYFRDRTLVLTGGQSSQYNLQPTAAATRASEYTTSLDSGRAEENATITKTTDLYIVSEQRENFSPELNGSGVGTDGNGEESAWIRTY